MNKSAFFAQNHVHLASGTQTASPQKPWWNVLWTLGFRRSDAATVPASPHPRPYESAAHRQTIDQMAHLSTALNCKHGIRDHVPDLVYLEQNVNVSQCRGISAVPKPILDRAIPQLASLPNFKHSTHLQDLMMQIIRLTSPGILGMGFGEVSAKAQQDETAGRADVDADDSSWLDTCIEPRFDDLPIPMPAPAPAPVNRGSAIPQGGAWR